MPSDLIKPTSDLFMASLWSVPKNEPILRSLLNGVMTDAGESAVTKAIVLNPFNIQDSPLDKQIRLDVLVEDETKAVYNIEIQTDSHSGFFQRILYYWSETYGSQLQRGDDYFKLRPVRSIVITEFPIFPLLQKLHTIFEVRSRENSSVLLSDHFQIHFLRLGGWKEAAAKESGWKEAAAKEGGWLRNNLLGLEQCRLDLRRWIQFLGLGSELRATGGRRQ